MPVEFKPTARDMLFHKYSGRTCDHRDGMPIVWNGHLCEGANLTAPGGMDFCLWSKCGRHDVPANTAEIGHMEFVTCVECLATQEDRKDG